LAVAAVFDEVEATAALVGATADAGLDVEDDLFALLSVCVAFGFGDAQATNMKAINTTANLFILFSPWLCLQTVLSSVLIYMFVKNNLR
jgi:hypothetical protein